MRRKSIYAVASFALLAGVTSCSDAENKANICEETVGKKGVDWIKKGTEGATTPDHTDSSIKQIQKWYGEAAQSWGPDEPNAGGPKSQVCKFFHKSDSRAYFYLSVGAANGNYSYPPAAMLKKGEYVTEINSNAKLTLQILIGGNYDYRLIVKCKIAGSEPGQLEGLPFNAYIHDSLTDSTSHRERFTLLLAATQKALKGMGCQNNPVIPDTPPPSVK